MKLLTTAFLSLILTTSLAAQITPIAGSGCPGFGGFSSVGGSSPSSSSTWLLDCGPADGDSLCIGPKVMLIGVCSGPLPVPAPIGCGPCTLEISPSFGSFATAIAVAPGLPVGFTMCVQCGCLASDFVNPPCVSLGEASTVTILP